MAMHRIGQVEEAKSALEQLRQVCKQEDLIWNMDVQGLLSEAEGLIEGKKPN
jgi:hypothetical protein